jgi:N-acetylglucosaminyl-diphospho-decaprenol L-rhamnosyltransferase
VTAALTGPAADAATRVDTPGTGGAGTGPDVDVVVVTYRSGEVLGPFLDTLRAATERPVEVVVVDNSPALDDGTRAAAEGPGVRLLRSGGNLGYGRAANLGAAGGTADWVLVANPDVTFRPGALDRLMDAARRWPEAGAFGPAIVTEDGALYPSARALPSLTRGIGHALAGWWWPTNPWTAAYRNERGAPVEGPAGWLSGSCLLVRRAAFEAVSGFDPAFFMFMEDVDLGRRLGAAGWPSVYVPDAVICHVGGHSTAGASRRMLLAQHRSTYRYLAARYSGARHAPLRLVLGTGLAVRFAVAVAFEKPGQGAKPTRGADVLDTTA